MIPWILCPPWLKWTPCSSSDPVHIVLLAMNSLTLIKLKGNIYYSLHRIGSIIYKDDLQYCLIFYQIREGFLVSGEVPWGTTINQPISQSVRRRGNVEGQYKIALFFIIVNKIWFFIPGVNWFLGGLTISLRSRIPFSFSIGPFIPLIVVVEVSLGMIVIIIMRCVPYIWTLHCIVAKIIANKAPALPSSLRSRISMEMSFRPCIISLFVISGM